VIPLVGIGKLTSEEGMIDLRVRGGRAAVAGVSSLAQVTMCLAGLWCGSDGAGGFVVPFLVAQKAVYRLIIATPVVMGLVLVMGFVIVVVVVVVVVVTVVVVVVVVTVVVVVVVVTVVVVVVVVVVVTVVVVVVVVTVVVVVVVVLVVVVKSTAGALVKVPTPLAVARSLSPETADGFFGFVGVVLPGKEHLSVGAFSTATQLGLTVGGCVSDEALTS
jgi:hypothetical protein